MDTTTSPQSLPAAWSARAADQQDAVAVDHFSGAGDENGAVGIAVEGHAAIGAIATDGLGQALHMQRSTALVDIAAVGLGANGNHLRAQPPEQGRRQQVGGAVAAIHRDLHAVEADRSGGRQKLQVSAVQALIDAEANRPRGGVLLAQGQNAVFDGLLFGIRQLEAAMAEHLDAVVQIGIVRGGNHDSGRKGTGAGEVGDSRSGDDARVANARAAVNQTAGGHLRDPAAGFARIRADEDLGVGGGAPGILRQGRAKGVDCRGVQRVLARHPANSVRTEKLLGHSMLLRCSGWGTHCFFMATATVTSEGDSKRTKSSFTKALTWNSDDPVSRETSTGSVVALRCG